jgi:DNA-binding ferritin-like protein (Dps family)
MPDTESRTSSPVETERAVRLLNRSLRRLRVHRVDRRTITNDVRGDLNAAAAQGVDPVDLLGPDVDAFARSAMEANGVQPMADDYRRLLIGSTLAAALGIPAAYFLFFYLVHPLFVNWFELDGRYPTAGPVLALAVIVLMGTAVVLAALYAMLAGRPARNETVLRAGLLVPVGGGAGLRRRLPSWTGPASP